MPLWYGLSGVGLLNNLGELDFAGGTVIHVNAGVAGLVPALILGKRKEPSHIDPSLTKLTVLGSALLWFGWFGFNAGSQLAADAIAANAFLLTNVAACTGALAWMGVEWHK
jgi:Amt family ammonium transporter